jgi:hypothetical protein
MHKCISRTSSNQVEEILQIDVLMKKVTAKRKRERLLRRFLWCHWIAQQWAKEAQKKST